MYYAEISCRIPLKGSLDGNACETSVAGRKKNFKKAEFASTANINVSS